MLRKLPVSDQNIDFECVENDSFENMFETMNMSQMLNVLGERSSDEDSDDKAYVTHLGNTGTFHSKTNQIKNIKIYLNRNPQ